MSNIFQNSLNSMFHGVITRQLLYLRQYYPKKRLDKPRKRQFNKKKSFRRRQNFCQLSTGFQDVWTKVNYTKDWKRNYRIIDWLKRSNISGTIICSVFLCVIMKQLLYLSQNITKKRFNRA